MTEFQQVFLLGGIGDFIHFYSKLDAGVSGFFFVFGWILSLVQNILRRTHRQIVYLEPFDDLYF